MAFTAVVGLVLMIFGCGLIQFVEGPKPGNSRWYHYVAVLALLQGVILFTVGVCGMLWKVLP